MLVKMFLWFQLVLLSDVCSRVSDQFGLNQLFDDIETGWDVMIDRWDGLLIGQTLSICPTNETKDIQTGHWVIADWLMTKDQ